MSTTTKETKKHLLNTIKIDTFVHASFSVLVGNGYVQHTAAEHLRHHNLRYLLNFGPNHIRYTNKTELGSDSSQHTFVFYSIVPDIHRWMRQSVLKITAFLVCQASNIFDV